ncbi:CYP716A14v2 protein [Artemisia annua]|uniref:CYP716A14v2 protein n=1 Tax=Artemisia annua TaxID=35608 RepID=A0A2U1Q355_ARTAN|nr:CYP716A14v2 protein [Artemisia annua]
MVDLIYAIFLSLIVVLVPFSLHFVFYKSKLAVDRKLPPGQTGWPVIGETLDFLANGWKGHPEKFIFDRMAKFSPHVFRTSLFKEDVAVLCGSEGNKFLLSNKQKVVQPWLPSSVVKIFPSAIETTKNIKMLRSSFKPEALRQYVPVMDMMTQRHFETEWEGMDQIVTHQVTSNYTFSISCKIYMSIEEPEQVKYLYGPFEEFLTGMFSIPIDLPGTPLRRAINGGKFIRNEIILFIKQRKIDLAEGRASPTQDILSQMLCDEDNRFTGESDFADAMIGSLIAGHDNATSTCAFVVKFLAELPEIYQGVLKEQTEIVKSKAPGELLNWEDLSKMKYSWNVAREILRLAPPLQGFFREATADFVYNGYSIPKGWKLYWSALSTHNNPEYFPEPQKFDPSRFDGKGPAPYTFVPFGGGPHMCPGREYGRLQILIFMHHLVTKFKWEKVIPNEQIVVDPMPKLARGLPIRVYPYKA